MLNSTISSTINSIYMQIKREFWEHKGIVITFPISISLAVILLFTAAILYGFSIDNLQFRVDGQVVISEQTAENKIFFDGGDPSEIAGMQGVTHSFALAGKPLMTEHPELIRDVDMGEKAQQAHHSVSAYKQVLNMVLLRFFAVFNFVLLMILLTPLVGSLLNDKKDLTILFWRSLPVSETKNVLTKMATVLLLTPCFYFICLYLAIGACLLIFAITELFLSTTGSLEVTTVLLSSYSEMIPMGLSFAFLIIWMLPFYCLLALLSQFTSKLAHSVFAVVFSLTIIANVFSGNFVLLAIKDYIMQGFRTAELIRWKSLWPEINPNINSSWLLYGLVISVGLITLIIFMRRWRLE